MEAEKEKPRRMNSYVDEKISKYHKKISNSFKRISSVRHDGNKKYDVEKKKGFNAVAEYLHQQKTSNSTKDNIMDIEEHFSE